MKKSELKEMIKTILMSVVEARDYKAEYQNYHAKPEQKKNRAKRNNARRRFEREGRVKKGDGKDVDHKNPIRSGGANGNSNLRVTTKSANRARNGH